MASQPALAAIDFLDFSAPLVDQLSKSTDEQRAKKEYVENLFLRNQFIYADVLTHFIYGGYPHDVITKNLDRVLERSLRILQNDLSKVQSVSQQTPITIRDVEMRLKKDAGMGDLKGKVYLLMAMTGDDGKASEDPDGKQAVVLNSITLSSYSDLHQKNMPLHQNLWVKLGWGKLPRL